MGDTFTVGVDGRTKIHGTVGGALFGPSVSDPVEPLK